jgi:hypothetical protein
MPKHPHVLTALQVTQIQHFEDNPRFSSAVPLPASELIYGRYWNILQDFY